ncbi:hypothetical protein RND64_12320 [Gordonia sp. w5E2]|uniref:HNH endonuclease n=1 Tax=Gordonia jacobaea TaxID=122202 RepID=A0ABR5I7S0_9ACTN|nr:MULTISPECIES: hypothetical protein [Gordonia]KNA89678.1 hypothetical protein ABW18_19970 [Gordonia jacobaea]DAL64977.1 MAG TPA_asm: hypothetical protein [Caudoviricetes sp.]HQV19581.1 hypothetical protein [Gordonia sp. (in: high G+C Gram-positive bacteria)]
MSNDNINPDYEEVSNSQILDELRQINENLNGLYELLHDGLILPFKDDHAKALKALGAIKDHTDGIEANTSRIE